MRKSLIFPTLVLLSLSISTSAQLLNDITGGEYRPKKTVSAVPMADGEHYAQLVDKKHVVKYAYKNGVAVDTIFHAKKTGLMQLEDIQGFIFSKDESRMLVYRNKRPIYRHSFEADYYYFNVQRNELKALSDTMPLRSPAISPNGRYVSFVRNNNIYLYKADYNTEMAVTTDGEAGKVINGATDWLYEEEFSATQLMSWSPDSKLLAYVRTNEAKVSEVGFQTYVSTDTKSIIGSSQLESFKYPKAGETNPTVSVHIHDAYLKTTKQMQVTDAGTDIYIPHIRWTSSSEQLAIFTLNRNQNRFEMWLGNPKSTICRSVYLEEDKEYYVDYEQLNDFYFLSDNRFIAVNETDGYRHAYLYSATGIRQKQLTKGNFDVTAVYGVNEKTQTLYYQAAAPNPMCRSIYSVSLRKGQPVLLTPEEGMHQASFSANFNYFINHYNALHTPSVYTLRNQNGNILRTIAHNNEVKAAFEALGLPQKEFFSFTTPQNITLNGWMLKPANFDPNKRYPVVQMQYSGPNSQQVLNRWRINWEYHLAAQGYLVVCVDGRGTGARGTQFRKCTYMQLGQLEVQDQLAAAKYVGNLPYADKSRMAIWGWSYGGYMTLMCMSQPEQIFKAGISVAPVTDWRLYDTAYIERYMRRPQENHGGYESASVLSKASELKGRLLLVHGTADDNVHAVNSYLYMHALVEANKQFDTQLYIDDNHFMRKGNSYRHLHDKMMDFLHKNL